MGEAFSFRPRGEAPDRSAPARGDDQAGPRVGHSSVTITLDRYGHLMPGNRLEAAGLLAPYLEREQSPSGAQPRLAVDGRA